MTDYDGPERRTDVLGREMFRRAVADAAQEVARVHRIRLALTSALMTGGPVLAVMLPLMIARHNADVQNARSQSLAVCHVQAIARPQGNARAFVQREFAIVANLAFEQFSPAFKHAINARVNRDARLEAVAAVGGAPGAIPANYRQGWEGLVGLIEDVPLLNCKTIVG